MHVDMHVGPGVPDPRRDTVVRAFLRDADMVAVGSKDLEAQRAGNRGIIVARLEMIWRACEPHVRGMEVVGGTEVPVVADYRYVDLGARVLDRLIKVLEVLKPDPEGPEVDVVSRDPAAVVVSGQLDELERRAAGDQ